MGRDIKFRIFENNEMSNLDCLFLPHKEESIKVMQYTGLIDKNGIEIYEGDIVKHATIKGNLVIEYIQNKCKFDAVRKDINEFDVMYNLTEDMAKKRLEIIGNIYENKELLNA